jgi:hypothetical protein
MSTLPKPAQPITAEEKARGDLEGALCEIEGIADCLHHLAMGAVAGEEFRNAIAFLANRLHANHDAAHDAMCRIFHLDG